MTSPEKLEQEAEKLNISANTERCLGNCATCALACSERQRTMEAISEDGAEQLQEDEKIISDSPEIGLKPKTPEEIVESMRKAMGDDKINEVFAEYIRQIKPLRVTPQSNYHNPRDYFQIPGSKSVPYVA